MHTLSDIYQNIVSCKWNGSIALSSSDSRITCETLAENLKATYANLSEDICHGDVVILKVDASLESVSLLFSLWRLGAVIVPVKQNVEARAINDMAIDCNAKFLINANDQVVERLLSHITPSSRFIFKRHQRISGADRALIIYTSGSTGNPKGIILTHNNVISALRSISDYLEIGADERILNISPLSFDYGLYQVLFSVYCNCHVVLYDEANNPITLVKAIERHEITLIPALPVIATFLEKGAAVTKKTLPSLRKLTNTGGHLSEDSIDALLARFPRLSIYAMYGLTESKRALYLPPEDIQRKRGSVGIPMPGLEAKIFIESLDASGETIFTEAEAGQIGSLFVRGPSVMQGYTRSDDSSGARILTGTYRDDNWLDSGDLFTQDEDGYFFFKGRAKELIKQGGYCLYANDIENTVLAHADIQFASVVGTHDRMGSEIACLFIKLHEEISSDQESILAWIKTTLGPDYCPRMLKVIDEIKLSVNGKIDKKQLLEAYI